MIDLWKVSLYSCARVLAELSYLSLKSNQCLAARWFPPTSQRLSKPRCRFRWGGPATADGAQNIWNSWMRRFMAPGDINKLWKSFIFSADWSDCCLCPSLIICLSLLVSSRLFPLFLFLSLSCSDAAHYKFQHKSSSAVMKFIFKCSACQKISRPWSFSLISSLSFSHMKKPEQTNSWEQHFT